MDAVTALFKMALVLWVMAIGFAMILRGPTGALTTFQWPLARGFRLVRRMIGSLLVSIGQAIHPGRRQRH